LLVHVAPIVALVRGTELRDWIALAALYPVLSFGCGAGLHRYFAHRSFQTSRVFQFFIGLMGAAAFGDPIAFTARHRLHHAGSDTSRDVHSPKQGFLFCWFGTFLDYSLSEAEMTRLAPDLAVYPEIRWLHRFMLVPGTLVVVATWAIGGFGAFAIGYFGAWLATVHAGSAVNY